MLGVYGTWGTCPPRKILDFRPSEIAFGAVLGVKQQELDDQLPNLLIVFGAKFTLPQFKGVAQLPSEAQEKIFFLASYCIHSVIALWS